MYKRKDENEKIEKYLLKYGDIKKEKINNNIKIQKVKEMENCTFHPKINKLY